MAKAPVDPITLPTASEEELSATLPASGPHSTPADESDLTQVTPESPGRYALRGERGRGGMGRILVAFDQHVGREIALKQLLGPGDAEAAARFLREARVTGQLEHPNIVPVYEVGRGEKGALYYSMRLVRGRTLTAVLAEGRTLAERLRSLGSFWDLCKAVAYAHSRGVVHRDLKPDNVMVGEFGETVLLDWGLAKLTGGPSAPPSQLRLGDEASPTVGGAAVGTPCYMSPEQAVGTPADERSDVWGLGAVLYELLTGQPPFLGDSVLHTLSLVQGAPLVPVRTRAAEAPPELAAIAEKALRKDPGQRYASAQELAQDVSAYMTGGRVRAHAYRPWELLKRAAAQNKAVVAGIAVGLTCLLVALGLVTSALRQERASRLQSQTHLAQAYLERASKAFDDDDLDQTVALAAHSLLSNPAHPQGDCFDPAWAAASADARALRSTALSTVFQARLRNILELERTLAASDSLWPVAFSRDGRRVVAGGASSGKVFVWDARSGQLERELPAHGSVTVLAVSADGKTLATGNRDADIQLWDLDSGARGAVLEGQGAGSTDLAFSADGKVLASASTDGSGNLWDPVQGRRLVRLEGHGDSVTAVALSPDSRIAATGSDDRTVRLWSVPEGQPLATFSSSAAAIYAVAFSPDGRALAVGGEERAVRLLSVPDGRPLLSLAGHRDSVLSLVFSADGSLLASLGVDGTRVWDARAGVTLAAVAGLGGQDRGVAFSPDGRTLALAGDGRAVRLFKVGGDPRRAPLAGHTDAVNDLAFTPDGKRLVTSGYDRVIRVWDVASHRTVALLEGHGAGVFGLAMSPDGKKVASCAADLTMKTWDLDSGKEQLSAPLGERPYALAWSPDGALIASGGVQGVARLRDARTGAVVAELAGHEGPITRLRFSPDGALLATSGVDGKVRLWDVARRSLVKTVDAHGDWAWGVSFSGDGKTLVTAGKDGLAKLFDVETGRELKRFSAHGRWVNDARLSPDGRFLATGGDDRTARLFDLQTGAERLVLRASHSVDALTFSPDGRQLALAAGQLAEIYPVDLDALGELHPRPLLAGGK
ncbi:MAG: protein kinase [Myxococcales bacterium]